MAYRQFLKLRTKFRNDLLLFTEYKAVLDCYLAENVVEPIEKTSELNTFYLPRKAVNREDKSTSGVSIVFDASAMLNVKFH